MLFAAAISLQRYYMPIMIFRLLSCRRFDADAFAFARLPLSLDCRWPIYFIGWCQIFLIRRCFDFFCRRFSLWLISLMLLPFSSPCFDCCHFLLSAADVIADCYAFASLLFFAIIFSADARHCCQFISLLFSVFIISLIADWYFLDTSWLFASIFLLSPHSSSSDAFLMLLFFLIRLSPCWFRFFFASYVFDFWCFAMPLRASSFRTASQAHWYYWFIAILWYFRWCRQRLIRCATRRALLHTPFDAMPCHATFTLRSARDVLFRALRHAAYSCFYARTCFCWAYCALAAVPLPPWCRLIAAFDTPCRW